MNKKLPFDEKRYGEHKGERFSIFVLLDDGTNSLSDFYIYRHIDGNYMHFPNFYKNFHADMLLYENIPVKNRKYKLNHYADYLGQRLSIADPSHWL